MSQWLPALPAFVVVTGIVLIPGLAMAYAVGGRGVLAWGVAPTLGMTALTCGTAAAPFMVLGWSPVLLLASALAGVLVAAGVGMLLRTRWPRPAVADPPRSRALALGGVALGTVAVLAAALPGVGRPDELVDSTDAVVHLNRVRGFLEHRNFSSLTAPSYPSGFHDVAGSAMQLLPDLDIVRAANLTALLAAAVVWPLGVVALSRATFGRGGVVLLGAGLAGAAFTTFPFILMGWGVLWPNLLAIALLPGVAAPTLVAAGVVPAPPSLPRALAVVTTLACLPGLTLTHPNALVSLLVIVGLAVGTRLAQRALGSSALGSSGPSRRRAPPALAVLVVAVVAVLVAAPRVSRAVADTAGYDWGAPQPLGRTLAEIVLLKLQVSAAPWGLLLLMLLGLVVCLRRHRLLWVAVVWVACVLLYVLAATRRTGVVTLVTGYWYNDTVRLAAFAAVPGVLLAVAGIGRLAALMRRLLVTFSPPSGLQRGALPAAVLTGTLALVVVVTVGLDHQATDDLVSRYYRPAEPNRVLVTAAESADLGRLAALIPPGVVTAGVPANGSSFLYAFHGKPVLFDSLLLSPDADSALIGLHLKEASTRTDVCDALRRKNVQYAVTGPVRYWLSLSERTSGLAALGHTPGFEEVGAAGRYRLYRITVCGFEP